MVENKTRLCPQAAYILVGKTDIKHTRTQAMCADGGGDDRCTEMNRNGAGMPWMDQWLLLGRRAGQASPRK